MDKLKRLEKLKDFFDAIGGEIDGRKKIHKIIYLCQKKGIVFGQDFIFHYYGVFSPGLSSDLQQAEQWGIIEEKQIEHSWGISYSLKLKEADQNENYQEDILKHKDFITRIAKEKASVLEVLSTIVYLFHEGYSNEDIESKLADLKGHLDNFFPVAKKLAKELYDIGEA